VSSSEQLIRQYVRESLIAERKGRESVLRRGTGPGVSTLTGVKLILRTLTERREMFGELK